MRFVMVAFDKRRSAAGGWGREAGRAGPPPGVGHRRGPHRENLWAARAFRFGGATACRAADWQAAVKPGRAALAIRSRVASR